MDRFKFQNIVCNIKKSEKAQEKCWTEFSEILHRELNKQKKKATSEK